MEKSCINYFEDENAAIRGKRIIIEARKITKPVHYSDRTSRHGGQRLKAHDAKAWVEYGYCKGKKCEW
jgi:hypothetical protein